MNKVGKWQTRIADLAGLSVTVLLVATTGYFSIGSAAAWVDHLKVEDAGLRNQLGYVAQYQALLSEGEILLEELRKDVNALDERMPQEIRFADFYETISAQAEAHHVILPQLEPSSVTHRDEYNEMEVTVSAIATFEDFYQFLFAVGTLPRLAKIERMSIRPMGPQNRYNVNLVLKIYSVGSGNPSHGG